MRLNKNPLSFLSLACLLAITACGDKQEPSGDNGNNTPAEQNKVDQQSDASGSDLKACKSSKDCAADEYCDNGCRKLVAIAENCDMDEMCQSGHCADGVCCLTGCADKKKSCRILGSIGTCICRGHFTGENCQNCENNYFGANCDKKIHCEHGLVNDGPEGDGHCKSCNEGWSGKDCDMPKTCKNGSANVGLDGNGECNSCNSGWVGPNCDIPNNCLNGYIAESDVKSDGTCTCDEGYEGKNCEKHTVTCIIANAVGVNEETGLCTACKAPYYGDNCEKTTNCDSTGTASIDANGHCICKDDSHGSTCADRCAPKSSTPSLPSGRSCIFKEGHNDANCKISVCGENYKIASINGQVWMADNARHQVHNSTTYCSEGKCYYTFDEAANVCPNGWHVPSINEYTDLIKSTTTGLCRYTGNWSPKDCPAVLAKNGFDLNDSEYTGYYDGNILQNPQYSYWWSSTPNGDYGRNLLLWNDSTIGLDSTSTYQSKSLFLPVRCVKDDCTNGKTGMNCDITVTCNTGHGGKIDYTTGHCVAGSCNSDWKGDDCQTPACKPGENYVTLPSNYSTNCSFTSGHNRSACKITVCDEDYKVTYMNGKLWMAQNARHAVNDANIKCSSSAGSSNCYYTIDEANNKICPKGWHLPSQNDIKGLINNFAANTNTDISACKWKDTSWVNSEWSQSACTSVLTNAGFSMPDTGYYKSSSGALQGSSIFYMWTKDVKSANEPFAFARWSDSEISAQRILENTYYVPVRCVRD